MYEQIDASIACVLLTYMCVSDDWKEVEDKCRLGKLDFREAINERDGNNHEGTVSSLDRVIEVAPAFSKAHRIKVLIRLTRLHHLRTYGTNNIVCL